jgi:hypothetical protein
MGHKTKKTRSRSAKSGQYVTKEFAKANPDITVNESIPVPDAVPSTVQPGAMEDR